MRILKRALAVWMIAALIPCCFAEEGIVPSELDGGLEASVSVWQGDPYDADLLVGYVAQDYAQINPFYCSEQDLVSVNQLVFESLVTLNENQKPVPQLADNWTHEGTDWVFTIRSGISFHDGAEMTAYDVVASYQAFIANANSNPYGSRLSLFIEDMQAIDDRQLQVKGRYTGYMTLYAMDFPVVHASTTNDTMPRGTGAF